MCQVWEALGGNLVTVPVAAMVLHLSVGDTWNHINNVEKKLGVAVSVVFLVVSCMHCAVRTLFLPLQRKKITVLVFPTWQRVPHIT